MNGKTMKKKVAKKCDVTEFRPYDDIGRENKACSITT